MTLVFFVPVPFRLSQREHAVKRARFAALFGLVWACLASGCAKNQAGGAPTTLLGSLGLGNSATAQQQQLGLAQRSTELQSRASTLDTANQELERQLAQSRQEARVLSDQVAAMRDQLKSANQQVADLRGQFQDTSQRAEAMNASLKKRVGASITTNNSLQNNLPRIEIPGVEVRVDGDVVRVELPGNRLFEPGSARLTAQAAPLIDQVAGEIARAYPNQIIGVEGHTNSDPPPPGTWTSNHHLSVGEAVAVYDQLVARARVPANHLFVVGHGANHPVVSNGTTVGKQRNQRVELVVYPDRAPGK